MGTDSKDAAILASTFIPQLGNLKGNTLREIQGVTDGPMKLISQIFIVAAYCDLKACLLLCQDSQTPKYPGQAEILNRGTLELVFNHVFIAASPADRYQLYAKASYRDLHQELERYRRAYGADPAFSHLIKHKEKFLASLIGAAALTPAERTDPAKIKFWPSPKRMCDVSYGLSKADLDLIVYLRSWMYGEYSQNAHCTYTGVLNRTLGSAIELRTVFALPPEERFVAKESSDAVYRAVLFLLLLLSEAITVHGLKHLACDAKYIWGILAPPQHFLEANEVYALRYKQVWGEVC